MKEYRYFSRLLPLLLVFSFSSLYGYDRGFPEPHIKHNVTWDFSKTETVYKGEAHRFQATPEEQAGATSSFEEKVNNGHIRLTVCAQDGMWQSDNNSFGQRTNYLSGCFALKSGPPDSDKSKSNDQMFIKVEDGGFFNVDVTAMSIGLFGSTSNDRSMNDTAYSDPDDVTSTAGLKKSMMFNNSSYRVSLDVGNFVVDETIGDRKTDGETAIMKNKLIGLSTARLRFKFFVTTEDGKIFATSDMYADILFAPTEANACEAGEDCQSRVSGSISAGVRNLLINDSSLSFYYTKREHHQESFDSDLKQKTKISQQRDSVGASWKMYFAESAAIGLRYETVTVEEKRKNRHNVTSEMTAGTGAQTFFINFSF